MALEYIYNKIKNTLRKIDMKLEKAKYGYIDHLPKKIEYFNGGLYDVVYESSYKWPHNVALEYFDTQITFKGNWRRKRRKYYYLYAEHAGIDLFFLCGE